MTYPVHADPIVLRPHEGEYVVIGGNTRCTFKVTGRNTDNHFGSSSSKWIPEPSARARMSITT
jgi:hypothetical protein